MEIIYVSCLTESEKFFTLFKDFNRLPGQQGQKYHRLTVEGITKNGHSVHTVTSLPVTSKNCSVKFLRGEKSVKDGVEYNYLPVVNFPVIKNVFVMISSFFKTLSLIKKHKNSSVICDVLNISVVTGARLAAKITKTKAIGIVTDIPGFLSGNKKKLSVRINTKLMNSFDSYVFLTEEMKEVVNAKNKEYVVVEGLVDIEAKRMENCLENKYKSKVCMYAGRIEKIFGIKCLTEAFLEANIPGAELHIYGDGDYKDELIDICSKKDNVKYFGVKPNDEVVANQLKATLLINPRPTDEEFTKYSFPSKNMEYMVSGTPILTTKLPGMPKEYYPYVYLIEKEDVSSVAEKLKEVLSYSSTELHEMGVMSKEWVLANKNNVKQAQKLMTLAEN